MTPEERAKYLAQLVELAGLGDWEMTHSRADDILCEILRKLGYDDIVEAWDKVGKWYA